MTIARCVVSLDGTLRSASPSAPSHLPGGTRLPLPGHARWTTTGTTGARGPRPRCASASAACAPRSSEGIAAALALGVSRTSLHRWRGRYAEGGIEALRQRPRGPARGVPAGLGRAGRHRGAPPDLLEQQAPRRGVHAPGHLPARATMPSMPSSPSTGTARPSVRRERGPGLRAEPARRALAHRHQGPLLPAACPGRLHEGLDRRARRRPLPLPHRPARPAPTEHRAHPRLAARLLRAVRASRSRS